MKNNSLLHFVTNKYTGIIRIALLLLFVMLQVHKAGAQTWESVGTQESISAGGASYNNLVMDVNGNYYLSYYDVSVAKGSVQKFNGTTWSYAGGSAGITTGSATFNALATDSQGNVYYSNQMGYPESGMAVRKFDGSTWSLLPQVTTGGINYQAIGVSQDNVVFAYNNESNGTVKRYVNGAWEQVGNTGFSGGASYAEMAIANNTVYACNIAGGAAQVYKISTTATTSDSWTLVGGTTVAAASGSEQYTTDIALDANNNVYVAYVSNSAGGQKLNVKKFDGTAWVQVGEANFTEGRVPHVALAVTLGGEVYVAASNWENDNFLRNRVYKFDTTLGGWIILGGDFISAGQATYNDLIVDNANDYLILAYTDGNVKVKRISIAAPASVCTGAEPGPNTGDTSCINLTYQGEQVTYATVRGADGKVWLQQNLGSTAIAGAVADEAAYGDVYQWGRWADGHEKRDSATSAAPTPNNPSGLAGNTGQYVLGSNNTTSWWSGNALTDTWTGATPADANDINGCDPCKALLGQGWQLPTQEDWAALVTAESITNPASAFASSLKLPGNGYRSNTTGDFTYVGARGYYWSSTPSSTGAKYLYIGTTIANAGAGAPRGQGAAIRCVKAQQAITVQSVEVAVQGGVQPTIITIGGTLQLVATVLPATVNQAVQWSITAGNTTATVSATGLITALINGSATVRATSVQDPTKFADINITVAIPEPGYCEAYFINGCADYVYISGVATTGGTTNINNTSTGCSNDNSLAGYANYTAQSVTAPQGGSVGFTLNFHTASLGTSYLSAWIDWNHDFTFSDDEQVYASTGEEPGTLNFTASVPQNAALGTTRIRLKVVNGWIGSGACGYNSYGEVEDYTFNITEALPAPTVVVSTLNNAAAEITTANGTLQLVATVTPSTANQNVTWSIVTGSDFATINANGLVTAIANGTVTVRATSAENITSYGEFNITVNIAPTNDCQPLTYLYENFDTLSCCAMGVVPTCWDSILLGGASQIISSTQPASGTSQIYQNGYGAGKISIVVLPQFSNVNAGTHQFRFKVKANSTGALDFGYITDINNADTFVIIESLTINNTGYNSDDAERTFAVPATVPANARLALRNPGTTWAGIYWDDVYWEPIPVTITVATQNNIAAAITTNAGTLQLVATTTPAANTVNWTITQGNTNATVDDNGLVTATANGTVTVRATIAGTEIFDGITITISNQTVAVTAVTVTVSGNVAPTITTQNGTLQLVATITPADAINTAVTWSIISGSEVATVNANGLVTAVANGTVTVRATSVQDPSKYDDIEITVNYVIAVESIVITVEDDAAATITTENGTLQLIATAAPTTASQDVTWSIVSGDILATIDQEGLVTAVANGTVTVRATSVQDPTKYDDIEIVIFIESLGVGDVNQTTFSIYPNPVENNLNIVSNQQVKAVKVYNQIGQLIKTVKTNTVNFTGVAQGIYIIEAEFRNGAKTVQKVIRK